MYDQICLANKQSCLGYYNGYCVSIENCMHKEEKYMSIKESKRRYSKGIGQFVEYKGYVGSIKYSPEDKLYYGSLLIDDFVNYHADNLIDLEKEYHNAVDDYIEFKKEICKE